MLRKQLAAKNLAKKNDTITDQRVLAKITKDAKLIEEQKRGNNDEAIGAKIASHDSTYDLFKTTFSRNKDFVYGMRRPRETYITKALGSEAFALGGVPTVDMQNKYIVPDDKENANEIALNNAGKEVKEYHDFLTTHSNKKYNELAGYRNLIAKNDKDAPSNRTKQITRSCKAKIEETAHKGNTIHFILDNGNHAWDMDAVVKKNGQAGNLITAKELRHIYKNKDLQVGKSTLSNHIQFWREGKKAQAPWEENPELWRNFKHGCKKYTK